MKIRAIISRAAGLAVVAATVAGGSAQAATFQKVSACGASTDALSQPFLAWKDTNWYTLAPGQDESSFNGTGWTLTGGARVLTTTLADGSTAKVLDLPAGSKAVSPSMCVTSDFPSVRMKVRDVVGGPSAHLFVSYTNTPSWDKPASAGVVAGTATWGNSQQLQTHPGNLFGWQYVQYTFTGGTGTQHAQIYDFYVDPRSAW